MKEIMRSMATVKALNKAKGYHFFEGSTLRFFASKIESKLLYEKFFITSEKTGFRSEERAFTVREAKGSGDIETVGTFGQFATKRQAKDFVERLNKERDKTTFIEK